MAATVYRYKFDGPALTDLSRYVTGAVVRGSLSPVQYVDVTCDSTVKSDLDDFMASQGFSFDSTAPATTVQAQANTTNATGGGSSGGARLLEAFIDAPAEGWPSGVYREVTGAPFPSTVVWWTSSAKTTKIVDAVYTRNASKQATTVVWKMYASDGTTILATVTDTIVYSGMAETSRTRAIA